jgi:hypothetical protein
LDPGAQRRCGLARLASPLLSAQNRGKMPGDGWTQHHGARYTRDGYDAVSARAVLVGAMGDVGAFRMWHVGERNLYQRPARHEDPAVTWLGPHLREWPARATAHRPGDSRGRADPRPQRAGNRSHDRSTASPSGPARLRRRGRRRRPRARRLPSGIGFVFAGPGRDHPARHVHRVHGEGASLAAVQGLPAASVTAPSGRRPAPTERHRLLLRGSLRARSQAEGSGPHEDPGRHHRPVVVSSALGASLPEMLEVSDIGSPVDCLHQYAPTITSVQVVEVITKRGGHDRPDQESWTGHVGPG